MDDEEIQVTSAQAMQLLDRLNAAIRLMAKVTIYPSSYPLEIKYIAEELEDWVARIEGLIEIYANTR